MWKVKRREDRDRIVLTLSGHVQSEHVNELRQVFVSEAATQDLILDLKDLKLVDQNVVSAQLIRTWVSEGHFTWLISADTVAEYKAVLTRLGVRPQDFVQLFFYQLDPLMNHGFSSWQRRGHLALGGNGN